jgi:hypothetical protein
MKFQIVFILLFSNFLFAQNSAVHVENLNSVSINSPSMEWRKKPTVYQIYPRSWFDTNGDTILHKVIRSESLYYKWRIHV